MVDNENKQLSPEDELQKSTEIFTKEIEELEKEGVSTWSENKKQQFLIKLCVKAPHGKDINEILTKLLGTAKNEFNKPSYIYAIEPLSGQRPANMACKYGNHPMLHILITKLGVQLSRKNKYGHASLHSAVLGIATNHSTEEDALKCIEMIVKDKFVLDILSNDGETALCIAVKRNIPNRIINILIQAGAYVSSFVQNQVNNDEVDTSDSIMKRDNYPHKDLINKLKYLLENGDELNFKKLIKEYEITTKEDSQDGYNNDLKYEINQLIRIAIYKNMPEAIKLLLNCGADINRDFHNGKTLLHEAIELKRFECVKILLDYQKCNINARIKSKPKLESLGGMRMRAVMPPGFKKAARIKPVSEIDHDSVPQYPEYRLLLPDTDNIEGDTPIHLALKTGDTKIVKLLAEHDADLFQENIQGYKPITLMTTQQVKNYFDFKVGRGKKKENILSFDFNCLLLKNSDNENQTQSKTMETELEVLRFIVDSQKHRQILTHPLIRCFLYLKMERVFWLFWINFIFYLLFIVFLSLLVFPFKEETHWVPRYIYWWFVAVFTLLFLLREILQVSIAFKTYFKHRENWLELFTIACTIAVLLLSYDDKIYINKFLYSITILLAYIELMLMIGRHPRLSTFIHIFFRVTASAFQFMLWYSPLLLAFIFIFYIILHDKQPAEDKPSFVPFTETIFRMFVMLSGEFDATDVWTSDISYGKIFFVFFIFLIVIVLVNLLNALAVSDTNAVKEESEILSYVSQVKFLYRVEIALSRKWFSKFTLAKMILNHFRLLSGNIEIKKANSVENGNTNEMRPLNNLYDREVDADEDCIIFDLSIQRRLKFNKKRRILIVQLLTNTNTRSILKNIWNRLKFLPPFETILDDALDLTQATSDSVEERIENLNTLMNSKIVAIESKLDILTSNMLQILGKLNAPEDVQ